MHSQLHLKVGTIQTDIHVHRLYSLQTNSMERQTDGQIPILFTLLSWMLFLGGGGSGLDEGLPSGTSLLEGGGGGP